MFETYETVLARAIAFDPTDPSATEIERKRFGKILRNHEDRKPIEDDVMPLFAGTKAKRYYDLALLGIDPKPACGKFCRWIAATENEDIIHELFTMLADIASKSTGADRANIIETLVRTIERLDWNASSMHETWLMNMTERMCSLLSRNEEAILRRLVTNSALPPSARIPVVVKFGKRSDQFVRPYLNDFMDIPGEHWIHERAIDTARRIGAVELLPKISAFLESPDKNVSRAARKAIAALSLSV